MKPWVEHPVVRGQKLYLFFDPTHNLKNAYNNWINKEVFHYPKGFDDILDENSCADFRHIKSLFFKEETFPLKIAHMLTKTALNPSSIARTSPRHALGMNNYVIDL